MQSRTEAKTYIQLVKQRGIISYNDGMNELPSLSLPAWNAIGIICAFTTHPYPPPPYNSRFDKQWKQASNATRNERWTQRRCHLNSLLNSSKAFSSSLGRKCCHKRRRDLVAAGGYVNVVIAAGGVPKYHAVRVESGCRDGC